MNEHSTPEKRERQAEQLKKAVERLKKGEDENQREQSKRPISPEAKYPQKKPKGGTSAKQ
jgi:hypothetical protein